MIPIQATLAARLADRAGSAGAQHRELPSPQQFSVR